MSSKKEEPLKLLSNIVRCLVLELYGKPINKGDAEWYLDELDKVDYIISSGKTYLYDCSCGYRNFGMPEDGLCKGCKGDMKKALLNKTNNNAKRKN